MRGALLLCALVLFGCGRDVDLGGTADGGTPQDAAGTMHTCQPCLTAQECAADSTCAQVAGDTYCAALCPNGNECLSGDACQNIVTASGARTNACVPTSGACAPVTGPVVDGGICGALAGPSVTAQCHACGRYSSDCQPNGCYGGYWCDTSTRDCQKPPTHCP